MYCSQYWLQGTPNLKEIIRLSIDIKAYQDPPSQKSIEEHVLHKMMMDNLDDSQLVFSLMTEPYRVLNLVFVTGGTWYTVSSLRDTRAAGNLINSLFLQPTPCECESHQGYSANINTRQAASVQTFVDLKSLNRGP